jgi:hypothetical protein
MAGGGLKNTWVTGFLAAGGRQISRPSCALSKIKFVFRLRSTLHEAFFSAHGMAPHEFTDGGGPVAGDSRQFAVLDGDLAIA